MTITPTEHILDLTRKQGMIRLRDLKLYGIQHSAVHRLFKQGDLIRSGRGIYMLPDWEPSKSVSFAEACLRVPRGVICLKSALRFHELGTQDPRQVWIAIHPKDRRPQVNYPPLRIVRFSGKALTEGVEEHSSLEGPIRVYTPAKTIVDCFRYRNKIGLDVAIEALRDAWRSKKVTMDELWEYSKSLRVNTIIKPYLESLI